MHPAFLAPARELFGNGAFRRMWRVGAFASLSRWFELVAVALFVLELTGSATQVAIVAAARMAPMTLLGPVTGVLADSGDRRRLLLGIYAATTLSAAVMAVLVALGEPPYLAIVATAFVGGLGFVGELPLRRAILADSVPPDQVVSEIRTYETRGSVWLGSCGDTRLV